MSDQSVLKKLGKIIRLHRLNKKMTQSELAFKTGLAQSSINRIESGNTNVTFLYLFRLANALEISLPDLLADFEKE